MVRIIKNQIVSKPDILEYWEDNKVVKKEKTWENLKEFVGVRVPITDGHPEGKVLTPSTKTYGWATYKACPRAKNILCADLELDDDAPTRAGVSQGYIYEDHKPVSVAADTHQFIKSINHLALTDTPRDPFATKEMSKILVGGDTKTANIAEKNNSEFILKIGLDSFNEFRKDIDITMTPEEIAEMNALRAKVASFEALKTAGDSFKADIDSKNKEITSLKEIIAKNEADAKDMKSEIDSYRAKEKEAKIKEMNNIVQELIKNGTDEKDLKGESYECIMGRYKQMKNKPKSNVQLSDGDAKSTNGTKFRSTNDYTWNGKDWV